MSKNKEITIGESGGTLIIRVPKDFKEALKLAKGDKVVAVLNGCVMQIAKSCNESVLNEKIEFRRYRGKTMHGEQWVYGTLQKPEEPFVTVIKTLHTVQDQIGNEKVFETFMRVQCRTLGRSSRKFDKNGKEVFDRDIVRFNDGAIGIVFEINDEFKIGYISWKDVGKPTRIDLVSSAEAIGNIYDNQDLLVVSKEDYQAIGDLARTYVIVREE